MAAVDLLRLAWEADHDGRAQLRDSLLTLAVAESEPGDSWAERCRARLVADRPDHFFGHFPTVGRAQADPRVIDARNRLRIKFPPARVRSLLLRANVGRGSYTGRIESLGAMLEDLIGPPAEAGNVRLDAAQPSRGPLHRNRVSRTLAWSLTYPPMKPAREPDDQEAYPIHPEEPDSAETPTSTASFSVYYLTVLLAIAFLLATVQGPPDIQSRRD